MSKLFRIKVSGMFNMIYQQLTILNFLHLVLSLVTIKDLLKTHKTLTHMANVRRDLSYDT